MTRIDDRLDANGFPIPATFEHPSGTPPANRGRFLRVAAVLLIVVVAVGGLAKLAGPKIVSHVCTRLGIEACNKNEFASAKKYLDIAIWMDPKHRKAYEYRCIANSQTGYVREALSDLEKVMRHSSINRPSLYGQRTDLLTRLAFIEPDRAAEHHRRAIEDAERSISLVGRADENSSDNHQLRYAQVLNLRAYARANAGVELDQALTDANQALTIMERFVGSTKPEDLDVGHMNPTLLSLLHAQMCYLDTRGYILRQLNRHDDALADLDLGIAIVEAGQPAMMQFVRRAGLGRAERDRENERWQSALAVLMYHRGQLKEAMGQTREAADDFQRAAELGYDPRLGVY